jgi:hypothetical protein
MQVEQPHALGQRDAIRRLDGFLDGLVQQPPGGVTITVVRREWTGGRMDFSFTAGQGLFSTSISGVMEVLDDRVILESDLPALVRNFLGEDRIKQVVAHELASILGAPRA